MKAWLLARRSLSYARVRTTVLVLAVALMALLPFAVEGLLGSVSGRLTARADATPLLLGAPGSRFDLVLHALYFRGQVDAPLSMRAVDEVRATGLAAPIPIHSRATARGWPLVGTTPDYFSFRGLRAADGDLPFLLGECCLGAEVAARLGLAVGDKLLSDRRSVYAIDDGYPLRMPVVDASMESQQTMICLPSVAMDARLASAPDPLRSIGSIWLPSSGTSAYKICRRLSISDMAVKAICILFSK